MLKKIAKRLSDFPKLKRTLKNAYTVLGALISEKGRVPEEVKQISSSNKSNLFGYYDKSPWSSDCRRMIYLRVDDALTNPDNISEAEIILFNLDTNTESIVATTNAWNVQQGSMLQWLGPDFNTKIIYNEFGENGYNSVILDVITKEKTTLELPIYSVDSKGRFALSLDFSRLHILRPGYGYANTKVVLSSESDQACIWYLDFEKQEVYELMHFSDLLKENQTHTMLNAQHKVNHIMLSPDSLNFVFLHRWILNGVKHERLYSYDLSEKKLTLLLDNSLVSHYSWKNNCTIVVWADIPKQGPHYYLINLQNPGQIVPFATDFLNEDGHPSFSPDGAWFITDTYPDFHRKQKLILCNSDGKDCKVLTSIYSNVKYRNEVRCDLHPRWSPDSKTICIDAAPDDKRQVFTINIKVER